MVVDDESSVREIYARWLSDLFPSAKIIGRFDFVEPVEPVDVILLDLYLAGPWELTLETLRALHDRIPPVVCMTGRHGADEVREACIAAGAQDFISKDRIQMDRTALAEKLTLAYLRHAAQRA